VHRRGYHIVGDEREGYVRGGIEGKIGVIYGERVLVAVESLYALWRSGVEQPLERRLGINWRRKHLPPFDNACSRVRLALTFPPDLVPLDSRLSFVKFYGVSYPDRLM